MPAPRFFTSPALLLALCLAPLGMYAARADSAQEARTPPRDAAPEGTHPSPRDAAIRAYHEGRYEDALSALARAPNASDLAYLRIRVLADLGRYAEALDASKKPDEAWPDGVTRGLAELRVGWAAHAGRCDLVEAQADTSKSKSTARLVARCAFESHDYPRAKSLLAGAKDAEGRAMYIRALIDSGEEDAARPLARTFICEYPAHHDTDRFQRFLAPDLAALPLSTDEHLRRAEGFLTARLPEAAVDELAPLRKIDDRKLRARVYHTRGEALFRTRRRYADAHKAFAMAAKLGGDTEEYDAFHAVRASSRAGDDRKAIVRYKEFAKRYPKSRLTPDALFLSAWLSTREKLPSASKELERFVNSKYATQAPGLRRDALWHLAFTAFEKRASREAKKWLESYEGAVTAPLDRARAAYWRGRTALLARDKTEARFQFERALREERLGYYAQLAARRLIALGDPAPPAFDAAPSPMPRPSLPKLPDELRFYRSLGFYADAADVASRLLGNEQDRARRVGVFLESGEPYHVSAAADALAEQALAGPPDPARAWIWSAVLPRPYEDIVREQTAKNDLSPHLFYGHMQVESRYRPRVVSGADAIGLMQMLPQTAAKVGEGLGLKIKRADLLRPHVNITLGASYLGGLVTRYHGQFPVAIAAYNAGTQKVEEWLGRSKEFELDRWVELIPVEQTRNYVRRVIAGWSRYHAFADPSEPWALPLPEKVSLPTR